MTIPLPPEDERELEPEVVEKGARAMHNRLHVVVQNLDWDWDDSGQTTQELAADAFAWGVEQSGLPAQLAEWKRRALASESEVQRLARELGASRVAVAVVSGYQAFLERKADLVTAMERAEGS